MKFALLFVFLPLLTLQGRDADGFVPMFNGKDLRGWRPVNVAEDTFRWQNDMVVTTGFPTGFMATERMYENFIIELDWRHMKEAGNAGVFIWGEGLPAPGVPFARGIEVQVLDLGYEKNKGADEWFTSHGDIFPIWGATMTPWGRIASGGKRSFPTENRVKPSPEWNHYRIECNQGDIRLSVNGKEVTVGKDCTPRKGYLCLESEGSECHFKNVRIKELPSTSATPEQTARGYEGFRQLFTGKDLGGWTAPMTDPLVWKAEGATFTGIATSRAGAYDLWTEKEYENFILCVDWRLKGRLEQREAESAISIRGASGAKIIINAAMGGSGAVSDNTGGALNLPSQKADLPLGKWNRFFITVAGNQVTVELNDHSIVKNGQVPNLAAKGRIGLPHALGGIEFSNMFIKEL